MNKMYFSLFSLAFMVIITLSHAQESVQITGDIVADSNKQAIAFANVALLSSSDSLLVNGTISNMDGAFFMTASPNHDYLLRISYLGYKTYFQAINIIDHNSIKLNEIKLKSSIINLKEATVIADRKKAKSSVDKTTYYINKPMVVSSSDGIDILKNIPGVQVDLQRNISLEGSVNIVLMVNGIERNKDFVSQLDPKTIDKIDIVSMPGSKYDANITGVINIVLKKDHDNGVSGRVNLEIPTSSKMIFIFPNYSLNITRNKWNIYTSYNGEWSYFDIKEIIDQRLDYNNENKYIHSVNYIRQKKWSHVFHYGTDFIVNNHHQLSFYGMINPYSFEHDGTVGYDIVIGKEKVQWDALKDDDDRDLLGYHSLYYKYSGQASTIDCDINLSTLNGRGVTHLNSIVEDSDESIISSSYPRERLMSVQINYTKKIRDKWNLDAGVKTSYQHMWDGRLEDFDFKEQVNASYLAVKFRNTDIQFSTGVRVEYAKSELEALSNRSDLSWLPSFDLQKNLGESSKLKLNYRRWLWRPGVREKNPVVITNTPYSQERGNPNLTPSFTNSLMLEYSRQKINYFAARLFFQQSTDVISNLYFIDDGGVLQKTVENAGTKYQYGVQLLNSLKIGKKLTLNSFVKMYEITTKPNSISRNYGVGRNDWFVFGTSFSLVALLKENLTASLNMEYSTPQTEIQDNYYDDPLYFVSLDKSYRKWKFGIVSAIPFDKYFLYDSNDIEGGAFKSTYKGYVNKMLIPVWFKVSFQFNKGKSIKIKRNNQPKISKTKQGF